MICRCKNCGAPAKFDPASNKMVCAFCDSTFEANELENREYIEYNVYTCSACDGELRINGVEASTFCPYCGQPTIAYSRVSKEVQPDVIIPFEVTKEEALEAVRSSLSRNIFIPKEIKNFDLDRIRGIYMPFWLFDVKFTGKSIVESDHGSGKNHIYYHYYRHGKCEFTNFAADGSKRLNDESSQRLEPFDFSKTVPFNINYLSGFYADRYDVDDQNVEDIIINRAQEYYEYEVLGSVDGCNARITERDNTYTLSNTRYGFLPVWFLTFRYKDKPYTFLVNGQTKKVVGGVPVKKPIVIGLWVILCALLYVPSNLLVRFCLHVIKPGHGIVFLLSIIGFAIMAGYAFACDLQKARKLTTSKMVKNMVADREEEK